MSEATITDINNDGADEGSTSRWVTFNVADERYGVHVMSVQEVLRPTEMAPVPGAPHFVQGIINLRGNVVTVIDIRKRMGLPTIEADDLSRVVVLDVMGQMVGLFVDSVAEVEDILETDIDTSPAAGNNQSNDFIQGVINLESGLLILLDVDRLLMVDEWGSMSA